MNLEDEAIPPEHQAFIDKGQYDNFIGIYTDAVPRSFCNSLKEYMDIREETLIEIGKIKGTDNKYGNVASQHYYLKNTMLTQPFRKNLQKIGERLSYENAEFAVFWNLIGSKELNKEYYEDREGNIISVLEELDN